MKMTVCTEKNEISEISTILPSITQKMFIGTLICQKLPC